MAPSWFLITLMQTGLFGRWILLLHLLPWGFILCIVIRFLREMPVQIIIIEMRLFKRPAAHPVGYGQFHRFFEVLFHHFSPSLECSDGLCGPDNGQLSPVGPDPEIGAYLDD